MGVHRRISHDRSDDGLAAAFVNDDRSELKAGSLDAVVAWHPDRLHRSPCELEDFIDLVDATGATVAAMQSGECDLSTASGRMTARVVSAVARADSEHKSERIRRQREQAAAAGVLNPAGSKKRRSASPGIQVAVEVRCQPDRVVTECGARRAPRRRVPHPLTATAEHSVTCAGASCLEGASGKSACRVSTASRMGPGRGELRHRLSDHPSARSVASLDEAIAPQSIIVYAMRGPEVSCRAEPRRVGGTSTRSR
jgi:hypothetical protein